MKHGKHYVDAAKQIDFSKLYDMNEALELACKTASAKFDETVELHVRLGVDGRHADQQVRGAVVLPNGTGKTVRVCAIAKGAAAAAAEAAGADIVGDDELIARIAGGFMDFDVVVTTPDMMGRVGRLGKVLGPRGLMPNPKAGTVAPDLGKAVTEAKAGKIEYRLDKQNINMGAEVVVCINFTDRCNGTIFKADTVTNINCQNGFEGRNDFLFFHMDTAHGGIHIHRSSTLKPNH